MRFLAHRVVALGAEPHRQDVVREPRRLAPRRRQRDVQADLVAIGEHLHPGEAVGVRPQRVVDAREVHVQLAAVLSEQMRQQEAHLEERERVLAREEQLVPVIGRRRLGRMPRHELVRQVQTHAALGADRRGEHDEEIQATRDLPAPEVAGSRGSPAVGAERPTRAADRPRGVHDLRGPDAGLSSGERRRERRVQLLQRDDEVVEGEGQVRPIGAQVAAPVDPRPQELAVVQLLVEQDVHHREEQRAFRAGVRRQPDVGFRGRVRQPGIDHDERGAARLAFDDALCVRVEVMAGLQM